MKNVILISGTYASALIGAGLASGSEIVAFFVKYGKYGFFGVFLCSVAFGLFLYALLCGCMRIQAYTAHDFAYGIGSRFGMTFFEGFLLIFLLCIYSAMIAASGEAVEFLFDTRSFFGKKLFVSVFFNVICILFIFLPTKKIMNIGGILGILLGLFIIFACVRLILYRGVQAFKPLDNWISSAVSYSGANLLPSLGLMCPVSKFIRSKKEAAATAALSSVIIFLILGCLFSAIGLYHGKTELGILPMLTLSKRQGTFFFILYAFVLLTAVFTTAVSSAYGIYDALLNKSSSITAVLIIFFSALFVSLLGFDVLINNVYKICGIAGVVFPTFIVVREFKFQKTAKTEENTR